MLTINTINQLTQELNHISSQQKIGFVPTMGALHLGHQSLIKKAIAETDFIIVSIFINPLQFGKNEDFSEYPRQLEQDQKICQELGVNLLFTPSAEEMNTLNSDTTLVIPPPSMTSVLCGKYRDGHFQGVATIVTKLFNLIRPQIAYFGQKDAQQVAIIKRIVKDLQIPVKIESCPIIREKSGLALSSRNQYLSPSQKQEALVLFRSLNLAREKFLEGEKNTNNLINLVQQQFVNTSLQLQYAEIVDPETLQPLTIINHSGLLAIARSAPLLVIAAYCGKTRLIDNMILTVRKPIIAIDGPAGAGKSTVSRRVAYQLGFVYLDTGAMYRAITWLVLKNKIPVDAEKEIANLVENAEIELIHNDNLDKPLTVKINDYDVTEAIRTPEVTAQVSAIASQKAVREKLVNLQKKFGEEGGIVAEGRDIGTNVFPHAELKIFLTASVSARAKRRSQDLINQGETNIDLTELETEIARRDHLDSTRELSPLQKAKDAIEINTDDLTIEEVTEKIINLFLQLSTIIQE